MPDPNPVFQCSARFSKFFARGFSSNSPLVSHTNRAGSALLLTALSPYRLSHPHIPTYTPVVHSPLTRACKFHNMSHFFGRRNHKELPPPPVPPAVAAATTMMMTRGRGVRNETGSPSRESSEASPGPAVAEFVFPTNQRSSSIRRSTAAVQETVINYASAQVMGRKHGAVGDIVVTEQFDLPNGQPVHVLAVFDSHGDKACAEYCSRHLLRHIQDMTTMLEEKEISEWDELLADAVRKLGDEWLNHFTNVDTSGSCATIAFIHGLDVLCANLGDCRMIVSHPSERVVQVCNNHRASNPDELKRISLAGGFVENGLVNNVLAPSRAFGFGGFRTGEPGKDIIIHDPHVVGIHLRATEPADKKSGMKSCFAVLASDGVFDRLTNAEVHKMVKDSLKVRPGDLEAAAAKVTKAASEANDDDVSCIVVEWKMVC